MCVFQFDPARTREWKTITWENGVYSEENPDVVIDISINSEKQWFADARLGAQYDGLIRNLSRMSVYDWKLQLELSGNQKKFALDSAWNGRYVIEDGIMTILPPKDYNREIKGGSKITLEYSQEIPDAVQRQTCCC